MTITIENRAWHEYEVAAYKDASDILEYLKENGKELDHAGACAFRLWIYLTSTHFKTLIGNHRPEMIVQRFQNFRETIAEALNIDINTEAWLDGDEEKETTMILSFIKRFSAVVMCPNCGCEFDAQDHPAKLYDGINDAINPDAAAQQDRP